MFILVPRLTTTQLIKQIYPLHRRQDLEALRQTWVFNFTAKQPLGELIIQLSVLY